MFDEDPNDQANISGADLAQLVDELKAANQRNLELLAVIDAMIEVLVIVDDEYCYSNDDRVTDVLRMAEERRKK